ncbi:putative uncharacterized protein C6orf183 [Melanotaenia boesemani]|uniref:putative uncharacterized protein C6orf183 n=1 Tax=Melanotaenia boesemani TaxID=1250792 RepID=UPI001C04F516|nr:putative uncharacterized protein C6orf183 [Melanotaenia boesemani]
MQRELESCLSLEYTPDSLPLLLHQDQMLNLRCEYEDAVQRARRLSASREKVLTSRGNPANLLTQDDVVIYLQWLICHLHSVQTIHNFLRIVDGIQVWILSVFQNVVSVFWIRSTMTASVADEVPLLTIHLEEFLPELQTLITYFQLPYDTGNLRTAADEMELFSRVWREFRGIFQQQEQTKTFPQYDGTDVKDNHWGRRSANMALRKDAKWIPFIQVKPRRDPWQQKLFTKLKEKKSVDGLLEMHCSFLQVTRIHLTSP